MINTKSNKDKYIENDNYNDLNIDNNNKLNNNNENLN